MPPALLARIEQAAANERVTLDAFVVEIIERGLKRGLDDVLTYGKRHARERGLKPSDVAKAVTETRAKGKQHGG